MIPIYDQQSGYKLIPVKAGTVIIDARLTQSRYQGRFRFTCAHELSHWVIDKEHFTRLGESAAMTKNVSSDANQLIERQADRLACRLLMPKSTVKTAFYKHCKEQNVITALAELFAVSRQAMEIRLTEMGLLC